jgi:hypothetical protein
MNRRPLLTAVPALLCGAPAIALPGDSNLATDNLSVWSGFPLRAGGPNHPPDCDRPADCRFAGGSSSITTMFCGPTIYDRAGNVTLPKPCNTVTSSWSCLTCGKAWTEKD